MLLLLLLMMMMMNFIVSMSYSLCFANQGEHECGWASNLAVNQSINQSIMTLSFDLGQH